MRKLNNREIGILVVTLVLAALFVLKTWVIKPLQGDEVDREIKSNYSKLKKVQNLLYRRKDVEERYGQLLEVIGIAGSEASERSVVNSLVESSASQNNVHIANMQPRRVLAGDNVSFFPVELEVSGNWTSIASFLVMLQSKPNYFFIDEMTIEKAADTSGRMTGHMVLSRMRLNKP